MINTTNNSQTKQPKELTLLLFTEGWERFGYYTLQTIIILYMTSALHYPDKKANIIFAACSALMYLTPPIGGYIADRLLGFQKTILFGAVFLTLGYLFCALPGEQNFFLGLSILICANGLFKPNISSIVGELYHENDPRREGGFTLFYMGINIGSLLPPLIAGAIVMHFNWHAGFSLAVGGMLIGLITFFLGKGRLGNIGKTPKHSPLTHSTKKKYLTYFIFFVGLLLAIAAARMIFFFPALTNIAVMVITASIILYALLIIMKQPKQDKHKMLASIILIIISIGFWAIYNQTFTSLMLFANRNMHKELFGLPITTEMTQFFNPFFIIVLSPLLSKLWIRLSKNKLNPSIPGKFILAICFISIGFITLALGTKYFSHHGVSSAWWLVASYFLQTIGELLLSPIGLAMITILTPKKYVGMMMGIWFLSLAAAFSVGGTLADIAAVPNGVGVVDSQHIYSHAFLLYGEIAAGLAIVSLCFFPLLRKLVKTPKAEL